MPQFAESSTTETDVFAGCMIIPVWISNDLKKQVIVDLSPQQYKQASDGRSLALFNHKLCFGKGTKETPHKWKRNVNGDYVNDCKDYERIIKDTFESHIRNSTLKPRIGD